MLLNVYYYIYSLKFAWFDFFGLRAYKDYLMPKPSL